MRWIAFVQERKIYQKMELLAIKQRKLKTLLACFLAIKTRLPHVEIKENLLNENGKIFNFVLVRINCDLEQISKRFLAIKRKSISFVIGKYNRKYIKLIKIEARKELSFLLFNSNLKYEILKRLTVEQRIISESFDSRGTFVLMLSDKIFPIHFQIIFFVCTLFTYKDRSFHSV